MAPSFTQGTAWTPQIFAKTARIQAAKASLQKWKQSQLKPRRRECRTASRMRALWVATANMSMPTESPELPFQPLSLHHYPTTDCLFHLMTLR